MTLFGFMTVAHHTRTMQRVAAFSYQEGAKASLQTAHRRVRLMITQLPAEARKTRERLHEVALALQELQDAVGRPEPDSGPKNTVAHAAAGKLTSTVVEGDPD